MVKGSCRLKKGGSKMTEAEIKQVLEEQKAFYRSGRTRDVNARLEMLKRLYKEMQNRQADISAALKKDLGKSEAESYMCEIGLTMSEISWLLKHTRRLSKEHRVRTPVTQYFSRSYQKPVPYGVALIMSPWNYPVLLSLDPLADAIAAGNTAVIKPSAYSPASSKILAEIISAVFPPGWVTVVTGGRAENTALLDQKWDRIFFTGSQNVGRLVMKKASENLTPVVLELGGKSPCIVDETAKIPLAAKRIVWGKFLNCGQTCVAPDYILCKPGIKDQLIAELKNQIRLQFGENPLKNEDYGKIINVKHFTRILDLIDKDKIVFGGKGDPATLKIEPTILDNVTWDDAVMQQEIFGPILPILTYNDMTELPDIVNHRPKPLALYIYSENKKNVKYITEYCQYGGGCVNDCIIHLATSSMPFGGVGESGMGAYHGKKGFESFSHYKSIVDKRTWFDMPMRYQPFKDFYNKLVRFFMK